MVSDFKRGEFCDAIQRIACPPQKRKLFVSSVNVFLYRLKSYRTQLLQIMAAMRENRQRIIKAQSFQASHGNKWLDSEVTAVKNCL